LVVRAFHHRSGTSCVGRSLSGKSGRSRSHRAAACACIGGIGAAGADREVGSRGEVSAPFAAGGNVRGRDPAGRRPYAEFRLPDAGSFVALLGDRCLRHEKRRRCRFLGEPAWFPEAPVRLARLFGVPLVMFACLHRGDAEYEVRFELLEDFQAGGAGRSRYRPRPPASRRSLRDTLPFGALQLVQLL